LDFPAEAIFVSRREIFPPGEGDVGVPTANEPGEKSTDRRRKEQEREIPNNFLRFSIQEQFSITLDTGRQL
jgi:hypothetical protein